MQDELGQLSRTGLDEQLVEGTCRYQNDARVDQYGPISISEVELRTIIEYVKPARTYWSG